MAKKRGILAKPLIAGSLLLALCAGVSLTVLLMHFPWAVQSQSSSVHESSFATYWPKSPLQDAIEEKKRLKRFALSEQRRRVALQLRRMDFLNATLVDLSKDDSVSIEREPKIDQSFRDFEWPSVSFSDRKKTSGDTSFLYLPVNGGFALKEGIHLHAGDELKFSAELAVEPRNVVFYAFPATTGELQGTLGKYSFRNEFGISDVQKLKRISHPVGDATAAQFRIKCVSGEFFLVFGKVFRFEQSGRIPIQISKTDNLWRPKGAEANQLTVAEKDSKADQGKDPKGDLPFPDLLLETVNPVVYADNSVSESPESAGDSTVALGYNLMVLHRHRRFEKVFKTKYTDVQEFFDDAVKIYDSSELSSKAVLVRMREFLAPEFRKFGYHVVAFGSEGFYGIDPQVMSGIENLDTSKWLSPSDAALVSKNRSLDGIEKPAKGLEAIFEKQDVVEIDHLDQESLARLAEHLQIAGKLQNNQNFNSYNEAFVFKSANHYLADLVAAVQQWSEDQWQTRFLHLIDLESAQGPGTSAPDTPFQSLSSGLLHNPSYLLSPSRWKSLAHENTVTKAFQQIMESLRVRRLTHRTLIALVETTTSSSGKESVSIRLKIPGLESLPGPQSTVYGTLDGALKKISDLVGISAGKVEVAKRAATRSYRLSLIGSASSCAKFRWKADAPLENIEWKNIKVEGKPERGILDFYPCTSNKPATVTWTQQIQGGVAKGKIDDSPNAESTLVEVIQQGLPGGEILQKKTEPGFAFFFGSEALSPVEKKLKQVFLGTENEPVLNRFTARPHELLLEKTRNSSAKTAGAGMALLEIVNSERSD